MYTPIYFKYKKYENVKYVAKLLVQSNVFNPLVKLEGASNLSWKMNPSSFGEMVSNVHRNELIKLYMISNVC